MYGVRNSSWNPTLFDFPNKNSNLKMKERVILRRRGLMKSHIQTYAFCLMSLSLPVPLFCFLSVFAMCVYLLSFFVSLPSSFFSPFFFFFARAGLSLFIEKFQRNCSLIFSQLINSWSSLRQFFSPQLLILCSAVPHYFHFSDCWQVTPLLLRCGVL